MITKIDYRKAVPGCNPITITEGTHLEKISDGAFNSYRICRDDPNHPWMTKNGRILDDITLHSYEAIALTLETVKEIQNRLK